MVKFTKSRNRPICSFYCSGALSWAIGRRVFKGHFERIQQKWKRDLKRTASCKAATPTDDGGDQAGAGGVSGAWQHVVHSAPSLYTMGGPSGFVCLTAAAPGWRSEPVANLAHATHKAKIKEPTHLRGCTALFRYVAFAFYTSVLSSCLTLAVFIATDTWDHFRRPNGVEEEGVHLHQVILL